MAHSGHQKVFILAGASFFFPLPRFNLPPSSSDLENKSSVLFGGNRHLLQGLTSNETQQRHFWEHSFNNAGETPGHIENTMHYTLWETCRGTNAFYSTPPIQVIFILLGVFSIGFTVAGWPCAQTLTHTHSCMHTHVHTRDGTPDVHWCM